jgi:hypothetical protein
VTAFDVVFEAAAAEASIGGEVPGQIAGRIAAIDARREEFTVERGSGEQVRVRCDATTTIWLDDVVPFSALSTGDTVVIHGEVDGELALRATGIESTYVLVAGRIDEVDRDALRTSAGTLQLTPYTRDIISGETVDGTWFRPGQHFEALVRQGVELQIACRILVD